MNKGAMNIHTKAVSCVDKYFQLLWLIQGSVIVESLDKNMFSFIGNYHSVFQSGCTILHSPSNERVPVIPHLHQHLVLSVVHILVIWIGVYLIFKICISLITNNAEQFYTLTCHLKFFSGEVSGKVFGSLFSWVIWSLIIEF